MRTFRVRHSTYYSYENNVSRSRNLCMQLPRPLAYQNILQESLTVSPEPETARELSDGLGNRLYDFTVTFPHLVFEVTLALELEVRARTWTQGCASLVEAHALQTDLRNKQNREAQIFAFPSRHVVWSSEIEQLTAPLRDGHLGPHACAQVLMEQIFREWKFKAGATNIHTTVFDLLQR